jgi:hypothetical protein
LDNKVKLGRAISITNINGSIGVLANSKIGSDQAIITITTA